VAEAVLPGEDGLRVYAALLPEDVLVDRFRLTADYIQQSEVLALELRLSLFLLGV
jgi:hypothetical protein